MRAITCFSCPLAVRGSRPAGQTWATGGCGGLCLSASCGLVQRRASLLFWRGVHCRSPVCFFPGACQVRHELVWLLFPGSIWSLGGCDRFCSSVVGYRVSRFGCCWGGHFVCCDCDACWGWRFCLLLPLLFLACLVISSVRGSPALAGVAVGCLVMGPTDVLGALQGKVSFFCPLFASSGGGAVTLPRIRLWMTDLSLLLPVPGMRLEVRILVALPGILTARLVLGRRGLLQGLSLCQSGARLRPPRPSGVADVDGSFTFAGFRLACGGLGGFSVAYSLFSSVGSSPVLLVSRFWSGFFHPLLGAPLLGRLSVVPAARLTAVSLAHGLAFGGLPCGGGLPHGY